MRKIVAAMNITLDGICDHTAVSPDGEIHQHYAELMESGDTALYGRITYQLMQYWKTIVDNPTGEKDTDDFAISMDRIQKVVFSNTLQNADWETARIAQRGLKEEVLYLKQQPGKDILVGSRSLIIALINLRLIDEFQLMIHPVIAGKGMLLFDKINDRTHWKLLNTKTFGSGAILLNYGLLTGEENPVI
ncbi:dihydrofolate reductase family protein [Dyadobacter sp. CY347]|uniref:dihydrofolate reductase family protein n=1 Tax=Dyadobacter sp. CY347 TaxID=2909336 RepID=UPI001F406E39|nr:dihydrofolate reductase family protein [Dyadobacter sp. CY347]MCF2487680.1 dihydrofolate reductase family protein [Dyadobacter sp. CY347]